MTELTKRKRSAERTRAQILDAAVDHFAEAGLDGARVDAIAAASGSNKRMIYAHFGSKEGLYDAALRSVIEAALDAMRATAHPDLPPEERTRRLVRGYMHFLAEHPRFVRFLAWQGLANTQDTSVATADLVGAGLDRLVQLAERGVADGVFQPVGDLRHLVVAVNGMCLGFFHRRAQLEALWGVDLSDPATIDALADVVERLVLGGLRAAPVTAASHRDASEPTR
ncbi:MAG: TetR family transcriptional regulator [Deltaproteobacteria bacterium]|nr:MAG: TetR family transcriptional regulator [Deltaproteobacteria bacterium]